MSWVTSIMAAIIAALTFVLGGYVLGPKLERDDLASLRRENASMQAVVIQLDAELQRLAPRVSRLESGYSELDDKLRKLPGEGAR